MQSIIMRFFSREQQLPNISIMGLDGAGKTTLLYKLRTSAVTDIVTAIGLWIETVNIQVPALPSSSPVGGGNNDARPLHFTARVANAGGCAKVYPLVRHVMIKEGEVSAIIWVVDVNAPELWIDMSLEELRILLHGDYATSVPVLVLADKIDLPPGNREFPVEGLRSRFEKLLQGRRFAIFETSICSITAGSRPESGLAEAFAWLGDVLTAASMSTSSSSPQGTELEKQTTVQDVLSNMRGPETLSAKLEDWLSRADEEAITLGDEELLRRFYALDLPAWDHYIHIRLAYVLLLKYGRKEVIWSTPGKDEIFDGLKEYIEKNGKGVHGVKSLHLTMTYFWVQMVHLGIARGTGTSTAVESDGLATTPEARSLHHVKSEKEAEEGWEVLAPADASISDFARFLMVNPYLVDGQLWADYYSKEVLMSPPAKEGLVFPDIKKLPDVL